MHGELENCTFGTEGAVGSQSLEYGHDRKYKDEPNYLG